MGSLLVSDPWFYLTAVPAVLLYGMSKGGLGAGPATLAVPLMAMVIDPVRAAAITLPILCLMDLFAVWAFRGKYSLHFLRIMLPAAVVGVAIAAAFMGRVSGDTVRVFVGLIAIAFCLLYWFKPSPPAGRRPGRLSGYFWSCIAGITSTQIHAGGPPASIYLLPQQLDRIVLMGTFAVFFTIVNLVKLVPYSMLGQFSTGNLLTSLLLMPLAPVGVRIGYWALHRFNQEIFYKYLYAVLMLSGCKLLWDGFVA